MLTKFKFYYHQARHRQSYFHEKSITYREYDQFVIDDLVKNVPIYDVVNRRYAAFSSLPEAIRYKSKDPKGNGKFYEAASISKDDFVRLCYLFRLCGSGINYKPKQEDDPKSSHGFGNFWIDKLIRRGYYRYDNWMDNLPDNKFCDSKGYLLPMIKGGLRPFILEKASRLVEHIWFHVGHTKLEIHEIVNIGNDWLLSHGYKRQNFVLCAFAMDLAEYFPSYVDQDSRVLIGSNAKKCLKRLFPAVKGIGINLDITNELLDLLCEQTGNFSKKYDMEDVACDFIRYIDNYQSKDHIIMNNGIIYKNRWTNL